MNRPANEWEDDGHAVMLFDGVCNLCNRAVQFFIKHDPDGYFRFASQQSEVGERLLALHGLSNENGKTVVLIEHGKAYVRSTAVLRMVRRIGLPWNLLYAVVILPRFVRNPLYDFVADRRYRWFGRKDVCMMPTERDRERFL